MNNSEPQKAAAKATHTSGKTAHNKKTLHQAETNNVQRFTESNKSSENILEGQKRQGCVPHTTTTARRPECGEGKPRKIKAKRCGAPKGGEGGEEEERVPVEFRWDTGKLCHHWLRSKGFQSIVKMLLKVKHCKGGRRLSVEFRLCFFSGHKQFLCEVVVDFFGGPRRRTSIATLSLTFCKSRRGFTQQPESPNVI